MFRIRVNSWEPGFWNGFGLNLLCNRAIRKLFESQSVRTGSCPGSSDISGGHAYYAGTWAPLLGLGLYRFHQGNADCVNLFVVSGFQDRVPEDQEHCQMQNQGDQKSDVRTTSSRVLNAHLESPSNSALDAPPYPACGNKTAHLVLSG